MDRFYRAVNRVGVYRFVSENETHVQLEMDGITEKFDLDEVFEINYNPTAHDPVHKPAHYTDGKIEVIDFIEDKQLGYHLGNVVKYVSRAGKKDASKIIQDLEKARWYLDRRIEQLKKEKDAEATKA